MTGALAKKWDEFARTPFFRLTVHCANRMMQGGEGSESNEVGLGVGAVAGFLAMPGAFISILMAGKYGSLFLYLSGRVHFDPYAASLPDEYLLIVLSMVVAGSVAVWKWHRLLLDRRDFANLAALSISTRTLLAANLLAIVTLAGGLALDVNAVSAFVFPAVVCDSQRSFSSFGVFFYTHLLTVFLASLFSFFAVFGVLALLMAVLPYRVFRALSVPLRCAIIVLLVAVLGASFTVPPQLLHPVHWLRFLPSVWFLELCQSLRNRAFPWLASIRIWAILATPLAMVAAIGACSLSYRRVFLKTAEARENPPAGKGARAPAALVKVLDNVVLRSPFRRAGYRFTLKTLFRSEVHLLTVGGAVGLGIVAVSQILFASAGTSFGTRPSPELLSIPLVISFCLILGLRLAFEIPAALRANWIFRLIAQPQARDCVSLARTVMLTFVLPWLALVCLPVYAYVWGWKAAVLHTAVTIAWSLLLTELVLLTFRKIPFTCSAPSFKRHAIVSVLIGITGFFMFSTGMANWEYWALEWPVRLLLLVPVFAGALLAMRTWRQEVMDDEPRVIFIEEPSGTVETLDLA